MPTMPIGSVILMTLKGNAIEKSPHFESFVFARIKYKGMKRYQFEIQQPELEVDWDTAWISLPEPGPKENIDGFDNPFSVIEDLWERDFDLVDCEVIDLNFSGPSKSVVWDLLKTYLGMTEYAKWPFFELGQIKVDGSPLFDAKDFAQSVITDHKGLAKVVQEISPNISFREVGMEAKSHHSLIARISCTFPGVQVESSIEPIVQEYEDEPNRVLVPGSNGADYSLTICGTWLVCEPKAIEIEHGDDGDEFTGSAYWTTVSHYEPELRLEKSSDFSSSTYSIIRTAILTSKAITDTCRASMLMTLL